MAQYVTNPRVSKLTTLGEGDAEIIEMTITNDKVVGKRFKEISPAKDFIIIATYQNGKLVLANENTKNMKIEILKLLKKNISDNRIKQLSSKDLDTASLLTPHILWMGLHCKDVWFTEKVSVDDLLKLFGSDRLNAVVESIYPSLSFIIIHHLHRYSKPPCRFSSQHRFSHLQATLSKLLFLQQLGQLLLQTHRFQ